MNDEGPRRSAWEYRVVPMGTPPPAGAEERANELGTQGWELAAVDAGVWVFKRPAPSDAPAADPLRAVLEETVPLTTPGAVPPTEAVGAPLRPPV